MCRARGTYFFKSDAIIPATEVFDIWLKVGLYAASHCIHAFTGFIFNNIVVRVFKIDTYFASVIESAECPPTMKNLIYASYNILFIHLSLNKI